MPTLRNRVYCCRMRLDFSIGAQGMALGKDSQRLAAGEQSMTRKSPRFAPTDAQNWRDLYTATLFETDKKELPALISEAERALLLRAQELFAMSDADNDEVQAVDDALYALRALRNCLELKTNEESAA